MRRRRRKRRSGSSCHWRGRRCRRGVERGKGEVLRAWIGGGLWCGRWYLGGRISVGEGVLALYSVIYPCGHGSGPCAGYYCRLYPCRVVFVMVTFASCCSRGVGHCLYPSLDLSPFHGHLLSSLGSDPGYVSRSSAPASSPHLHTLLSAETSIWTWI